MYMKPHWTALWLKLVHPGADMSLKEKMKHTIKTCSNERTNRPTSRLYLDGVCLSRNLFFSLLT